jgi:preprotein translocase subunit SecG
MSLLFVTLIIITCILLVLIILVQNPKGGGLSSTFGGGQQVFGGVRKTTDFLDKGTWGLAILLVVLVLGANVSLTADAGDGVVPESRIENVDAPASMPSQPFNAPQQTPPPAGDNAEFPEELPE